jgi:hypothetical protein
VGDLDLVDRGWQRLRRRVKGAPSCRRRVVIVIVGALVGLTITSTTARAVAAPLFTYGEGTAEAQSLDMDIVDSGANVNVYVGQATAGYQNTEANASASNVNVPLSRLLGVLQICSQPAPSLPLPQPLEVDTGTNGNTTSLSASTSSGDGAAGSQSVQAAPGSQASGEDTLSGLALPGVVEISGGQSKATVSADAQSLTRTAMVTSDISTVSVLGGAVKLGGLHWQLRQSEVGADNRSDQRSSSAVFTMDSISVGPVTIPISSPADLSQAAASANVLLAPLGLALRLPTQTATSAQQALSPLTVAVGGNSSLWGPVIAKLLGNATLDQVEQTLTGTLFDPATCDELGGLLKDTGELNLYWNFLGAAAPLAIGILGQALGGSGEIDFDIGGVSTSLDDTYYPPVTFGSPTFVFSSNSSAMSASTISPETPTSAVAAAPGTPAPPSGEQVSAVSTRCETTSPAGLPMCWGGQAPLGAAITGVAVIGMLVGDEVYRRRRSRQTASEEVS